jgi:hypothetical protein
VERHEGQDLNPQGAQEIRGHQSGEGAITEAWQMTYDDGLAIRQKWADGAMAELLGFKAPRLMSENPYLQGKYQQGFADAKAMMLCEEVASGLQLKEGGL